MNEKTTKRLTVIAAVAVALCMIIPAVYPHELPEPEEEDETLGFPWVAAALILNFAMGGVVGYIVHDHITDDIRGTTTQLRQIDRADEAKSIISNLDFIQSLMTERTTTGANSIKYISTYAERQAEVTVSDMWTPTGTFVAGDVLTESRIYERLSAEIKISEFYMSATFNPYRSLITGWNATLDNAATYGSGNMTVGFRWMQEDLSQSSYSPYMEYGLGTTVTSAAHSKVYIDPLDGTGAPPVLYVDGGSALITDASDSLKTYGLLNGKNDISSIPAGVYYLQPGRTYMGSIFQVVDPESADVTAAAAMVTGSDIAYAFMAGSGVDIVHSGVRVNSPYLVYQVVADGVIRSVDVIPSLASINTVMVECIDVAVRAGIAAQAMWLLFDMAGEALQYISPSSIIPDITSIGLSASETALISASALMQIADYVKRNKKNITEADIMVSPDAMQLLCIGKIQDNFGATVSENVVFTPLNWINDVTLKADGKEISWSQPGLAAIWGSADDFGESYGIPELQTLQPGYVLIIDEMYVGGDPATEFTLEVIPLPKLIDPKWVQHETHTATPDLINLADVVQLFFVIFGLLVAVTALLPRSPTMMIIGLVIAVVGYVGAGVIAAIIWGTPPWWWPF